MAVYIIAIPFYGIVDLPLVEKKIQVSELLFLFLFFPILIQWIKRPSSLFQILNGNVFYSILFYLFSVTLSCIYVNHFHSWLELFGLVYLVLVFIVFKYLSQDDKFDFDLFLVKNIYKLQTNHLTVSSNSAELIFLSFLYSGLIAAIIGIYGWLASFFGLETVLAFASDEPYPYLGNMGRAVGLTPSPSMLCIFLSIVSLLLAAKLFLDSKNIAAEYFSFAVLILGSLLTFSKTIILLLFCLLILFFLNFKNSYNWIKTPVIIGCTSLVIVFNLVTHILPIDKSSNSVEKIHQYVGDQVLMEWNNFLFFGTNYLEVKKSAVKSGVHNFPWGVGMGRHNEFMKKLKEAKLYPDHLPVIDPHSTYFGAFSETGILSLIAIFILVYFTGQTIYDLYHSIDVIPKYLLWGISISLLLIFLEAINTDVMNFRFLWVLLAIIGAYSSRILPKM